jgi:uncharacterized protein (DUF2252 family)
MSTTTTTARESPTVEAILRFNEGRKAELVRKKFERMGENVFAFFRGTDHLFASAWADLKPVDPGPSILICGDLHVENVGAYRAEDGDFVFDLNDFDESLIGPCSIDLVRCSTSVLLAAQVWGLSPIQAMRTVLGYLECYRKTIAEAVGGDHTGRVSTSEEFGPIEGLLGQCELATQVDLLHHITRVDKSGVRSIRRSEGKFPAPGKANASAVTQAVQEYGRAKGSPDHYDVLDVSARIAGIGSLGLRHLVVLIEGSGSPDGNRLLDLKEIGPSSLRELAEGPQPTAWTDDARRAVDTQRQLQGKPTAGLDVIELEGTAFRLRELIPDENRARIDQFRRKPSRLRRAVEVAGRITAWAQLRGARHDGGDRTEQLAKWAASPALDAVLASSVRFADRAREDYKSFRKARLDFQH